MKLALYSNAVSGGWDPTNPDTWGGGEEAIVRWSEAIAAQPGVEAVDAFYSPLADVPPPQPILTNLTWRPLDVATSHIGAYDVAVYRKTPEAVALRLAPVSILWTDQNVPFDATPFTSVVVASPYAARSLKALLPQTTNRLVQIPDGYPADLLAPRDEPRNPHHVLYCSSPDRGLVPLLAVWPRVRASVPDATLTVAYGWELFLRCGGSPLLKAQVEAMLAAMSDADRASVTMRRHGYDEMHATFRTAGVWAYWCQGGEWFCQVAVKAQVGGCYPVVRPWGALHDTVWRGTKLPRGATVEAFAAALIAACDPAVQDADRALPAPAHLAASWADVAARWMAEVITPALEGHTPEPPDLLKHLHQVPPVPPLVPTPAQDMPARVGQTVLELFQAWQPQQPWVSPAFPCLLHRNGIACGPTLGAGGVEAVDCAVLAFEVEDEAAPMEAIIRRLPFPDGTRLVCLASIGPWRAGTRYRTLSRRCLADVFSRQPEFTLRVVPLDGQGNSVLVVHCRLDRSRLGTRNLPRLAALTVPRETLAATFITYNAEGQLLRALESVRPVADQVVVVDTGSTDETLPIIERWAARTGIETLIERNGINPRYCFDCDTVHAVGEFQPGHHYAGFETPRNQCIAMATATHVLWLDADEELQYPENLKKYLRPTIFGGYALSQHHLSTEPPGSLKIDLPVRVFRRTPDGSPVGVHPDATGWPTYMTGCRQRFTGIVHEHPGQAPDYVNGIIPVICIQDVHIAHDGYFTEHGRRRRFIRNWPLMAADAEKYPHRRLTQFLLMRDIHHHLATIMAMPGGQGHPHVGPMAQQLAYLWESRFCDTADPFTQDALSFVSPAHQLLGVGQDYQVTVTAKKPEVSGEEQVVMQYQGRFADPEQVLRLLKTRLAEVTERWTGQYL